MNITTTQHKWIDRGVTILLIVMTLVCLLAVTQTMFAGNVTLFGHRIFYVVTGSMEPTIPTGSLIWVDIEDESYQEGDIITFLSQDQAIYGLPNTHRIVEVLDGGASYRTKGDANSSADVILVAQEDIIGTLDGQLAVGGILGFLASILNTSGGFLLLILCPMLVLTTVCIRDFTKALQEEVRRSAQARIDLERSATENTTEEEDFP